MNWENASCFLHTNLQTGDAVAISIFSDANLMFPSTWVTALQNLSSLATSQKPAMWLTNLIVFAVQRHVWLGTGLMGLGKFAANNVIDACAMLNADFSLAWDSCLPLWTVGGYTRHVKVKGSWEAIRIPPKTTRGMECDKEKLNTGHMKLQSKPSACLRIVWWKP